MSTLIAVFIGGGLGSMVRFAIQKYTATYHTVFPVATLISNTLACLILGIFINYLNT